MARVVIVSFMDNDAAERFIDLTLDVQEVGSMSKIEALIARPTVSCPHTYRKGDPYRKTERFGWWVHDPSSCNKPQRTIVRDFIKNLIICYNDLLPEIVTKRAKRAEGVAEVQEVVDKPEFATGGVITEQGTIHVTEAPHQESYEFWMVDSSNRTKKYKVERRGDRWSCECGDYVHRRAARGEECKHIVQKKQELVANALAQTLASGDAEIDPASPAAQVLAALGRPIEKDKTEDA